MANRDFEVGGIWADGAGDIPDTAPIPGTTYVNSKLTQAVIATAWTYTDPAASNDFNELMQRITLLLIEMEDQGVLSYSILTDYPIGAIAMGSDMFIYRAIATNGPGSTLVDPVGNPTVWSQVLPFPYATEDLDGVVQLSTQFEAEAGVNDTTAMTPLKVKYAINELGFWVADGVNRIKYPAPGGRITIGDNSHIEDVTGLGMRIYWSSNNTELFLRTGGNVGIGTETPDQKLHVVGKIQIVDGTEAAGYVLTDVAGTGVGTWMPGGGGGPGTGLWAQGAGDDIYRDIGAGLVGIGTPTPTSKLDLNGVVRIRGGNPEPDKILTATDTEGNAIWGAGIPVPPATDWTIQTGMPDNPWMSVAWGDNKFVAVASDGVERIMTSPDGVTWASLVAPAQLAWHDIIYAKNIFVAVEYWDGYTTDVGIMYSSDGENWFSSTVAKSHWDSIAYGNGVFVMVSNAQATSEPQIAISINGINWNRRPNVISRNDWQCITYGSNFVTVTGTTTGHKSARSADGLIWIENDLQETQRRNWTSITYGNGWYVAVCDDGPDQQVMLSNDGDNWSSSVTPANLDWTSITYGNGVFVVVSSNGVGNQVMASPDLGVTWSLQTTPANNAWQDVVYGNGVYVAVSNSGSNNRVMTSGATIVNTPPSGGITHGPVGFTDRMTIGTNPIDSLNSELNNEFTLEVLGHASIKEKLQIKGGDLQVGDIFVTDKYGIGNWQEGTGSKGMKWVSRYALENNTTWMDITYGNRLFVAVSLSGELGKPQIMTSPDGVNWAERISPIISQLRTVIYGAGLFVASSGEVITSYDGITWVERKHPTPNFSVSSIAYGKNLFVIVGSDYPTSGSDIMTSPDGINWTFLDALGFYVHWSDIVYGDGLFVAVGGAAHEDNIQVMTSPDGVNWTKRPIQFGSGWESITYGNGLYVAVSFGGDEQVMTSPNGVDWTLRQGVENNSWMGITYGNGVFVAVSRYQEEYGHTNLVMTSVDGINWKAQHTDGENYWQNITYANDMFVAVAYGELHQVMTSGKIGKSTAPENNTHQGPLSITHQLQISLPEPGEKVCALEEDIKLQVYGNTNINSKLWIGKNSSESEEELKKAFLPEDGRDFLELIVTGHTSIGRQLRILGGGPKKGRVLTDVTGTGLATWEDPPKIGKDWILRNTPLVGSWRNVAYGNNIFVAVADQGDATKYKVMTSVDGINWMVRSTDFDGRWTSLIYGNGLFVAVSTSRKENKTMTSVDGINWLMGIGPDDGVSWTSVAYGNNIFVAVSGSGKGRQAMTSIDGLNWTVQNTPGSNFWTYVTFGDGLFVSVSYTGDGDQCMTSLDGVEWTLQTTPKLFDVMGESVSWSSVSYGNGLFVAVSPSIMDEQIMISSNAIDWEAIITPTRQSWQDITYGMGFFIAISNNVRDSEVIVSEDGINWHHYPVPAMLTWRSISYHNGIFVVVASSPVDYQIMTSGKMMSNEIPWNNVYQGQTTFTNQVQITGGNPGLGRVLTDSDGKGLGTWQPLPPGNGSGSVTSIAASGLAVTDLPNNEPITDAGTIHVPIASLPEIEAAASNTVAMTPAGTKSAFDTFIKPLLPVPATEDTAGILEISTTSQATDGTNDTTAMTPLKVQQAIDAVTPEPTDPIDPIEYPPPATEDEAGIVELSTEDEALDGEDNTTAMTPLKVRYVFDQVPAVPDPLWEEDENSDNIYRYDGYVGIGTGIPTHTLHVNGIARANQFRNNLTKGGIGHISQKTGDNTDTTYPLIIQATGDNYAGGISSPDSSQGDINMLTGNAASVTDLNKTMTLKGGGNVGIGTETPGARLQVQETSTNFTDIGSEVFLVRKDITLTTANPISYTLATSRQSTDTPALYLGCDIENNAILATNNGDLIIGDNVSGVFSEKMRITQTGDVGIGENTPIRKLDVNGTMRVKNQIISKDADLVLEAAAGKYVEVKPQSDRYGLIVRAKETTDFGHLKSSETGFALSATAEEPHVFISKAGDVGIGTPTPAEKLHVTGNVRAAQFQNKLFEREVGYISKKIDDAAHTYPMMIQLSDGRYAGGISSKNADGDINMLTGCGIEFGDLNTTMTLKGDGRVGIGTTDPRTSLEVKGTITVTGGDPAEGQVLTSLDDTGQAIWGDPVTGVTMIQATGLATTGLDGGPITSRGIIDVPESTKEEAVAGIDGRSAMTPRRVKDAIDGIDSLWTENEAGHINRATGRVGIGISAPTQKLEVAGVAKASQFRVSHAGGTVGYVSRKASDNTQTTYPLLVQATGDNYAGGIGSGDAGNGDLCILTGNAKAVKDLNETMNLLGNGNVGVGVGAPQHKLDVNGTVRVNDKVISRDNHLILEAADGKYLEIKSHNADYGSVFRDTTGEGYGNLKATTTGFGISAKNKNPHIFIENGGNVGINTTAPTERLEVSGNVKADQFKNTLADGETGYVSKKSDNATTTYPLMVAASGANLAGGISSTDGSKGDLQILTGNSNNASTLNKTMTLLGDGNVGIGATAPTEKLDVNGAIRVNDRLVSKDNHLYLDAAAGKYVEVRSDNASYGLVIRENGAGTNFGNLKITAAGFQIGANSSDSHIFIKNNGNIGIGTETPDARLHVEGRVIVTGGSPGVGKVLTGTDDEGNCTWQDPAFMQGKNNTIYTNADGVGVGVDEPRARLDVKGDVLSTGREWVLRGGPVNKLLYLDFRSVAYGGGRFVAVGNNTSFVAISDDGINWRETSGPGGVGGVDWSSITYGQGLFVAVATNYGKKQVMTSPNGITWTIRSTPVQRDWRSVTYGNSLFVAVSANDSNNQVMTSPNGINWTARNIQLNQGWQSVTYGDGKYVAVSRHKTNKQVMTSLNGINWNLQTTPMQNTWNSVTYGNGKYVAVSDSGTSMRIMISTDGESWQAVRAIKDLRWRGITYGRGLFVVIADGGDRSEVMISMDGETWELADSPGTQDWKAVVYGNGVFVSVGFGDPGLEGFMSSGYPEAHHPADGDSISSATATSLPPVTINGISSTGAELTALVPHGLDFERIQEHTVALKVGGNTWRNPNTGVDTGYEAYIDETNVVLTRMSESSATENQPFHFVISQGI